MNVNNIVWRLAQLASLPYQEKYVISGNAEEYTLDSELLENVDSLKYLLRRSENRQQLAGDQLNALEDLFEYIERHSGEALSGTSRAEGATLIRDSAIWKNLRSKSAIALAHFGFLVDDLSAVEIDNLGDL